MTIEAAPGTLSTTASAAAWATALSGPELLVTSASVRTIGAAEAEETTGRLPVVTASAAPLVISARPRLEWVTGAACLPRDMPKDLHDEGLLLGWCRAPGAGMGSPGEVRWVRRPTWTPWRLRVRPPARRS